MTNDHCVHLLGFPFSWSVLLKYVLKRVLILRIENCKSSSLRELGKNIDNRLPLTQIPSEDMDLEETGSGSGSGTGSVCGSEPGSICEDDYRRRQSNASTDSVYDTESTTSSRESLIEPSYSYNQVKVTLTCAHIEIILIFLLPPGAWISESLLMTLISNISYHECPFLVH